VEMEIEESILRVQTAYPRIYLACHSRHQNTRTNQISQRDGSLLAHLNETNPTAQSDLAQHMGVAKSTLSEALGSLEERGLIARNGSGILRTNQGTAAMSNGSVLEPERLRRLLELLSEDERRRAIDGLELLAGAGRKVNEYVD